MRPGIAPELYRMGCVREILNLPAALEPFCIMPIGFASGKFASKILKFIACKAALAFLARENSLFVGGAYVYFAE